MTPILYEKDEIDFTSQGLGALAEIYDVDVAEQRNGLFQLTANYPVTGIRYDDISAGRIILAKPNQRDEPHAFRIVNTELDVMGYSLLIEADSITYDLNHNFIKHLTVNDATGQGMMSAIQAAIVNPSIFTFYSDITHKSSTKLDYVNPMEAVMGVQGSFLQYWGGELKRENRRVAMFNRRGRDNVATFRLGKNISGLKYKVDISSLVTRIMPVKSVQENDKTTYLEGTPVSSKYINNYEQIYTIKVDFTDDTIKTVDDLNKAAEGWFVDSANTGRDKPSVTIDIDVLSLQDSADFQDKFKNLESVALTDTVTVYVPEYGVNVTAIVNEIHFDPIQERVTKLVVGTAKQSFADSSRVQLSDLQGKIISVQEQADQIAVSANGKNSNYYGSVAPSHPQEGDFWYWKNGDLSGIKQFVNGDWADVVDTNTQQQIADSVNQAVQDAQKYSDKLVADNAEQVNRVLSDIQDEQGALKNEQGELDRKAQGYANQALADAKSDTQATVSQAARDAQQALANAKTELTENLSKEIRDRTNALTNLDQKATEAINQAKEDAQSAVNALSTGDRNYVLDTGNPKRLPGYGHDNFDYFNQAKLYKPLQSWGTKAEAPYVISFDWTLDTPLTADMNASVFFNQSPWQEQRYVIPANQKTGHTTFLIKLNAGLLTQQADITSLTFRVNNQLAQGNALTISNLYMKSGNVPTDWTPAPEDVVLDYTNKDNEIKRSLTQYQEFNDGRVSTAQSSVSQAIGELATKVSKTTFDQKTGQLQSDLNTTTNTVNTAKQDISKITSDNTVRDSKINSLTSDADETKRTISSLRGDLNTVSGDVSTLKQTAKGFEATVTKVNNMSIGGRNYVLDTGNPKTQQGNGRDNQDLINSAIFSSPIKNWGVANADYTISFDWKLAKELTAPMVLGVFFNQSPWQAIYNTLPAGKTSGHISYTIKLSAGILTATSDVTGLTFRVNSQLATGNSITYSHLKFEQGNMATDWSKAPEDLESATANAQYTADEATSTISKYKVSNDGRISNAESKINQNASAITTKVSQTDFNSMSGELTRKVNEAQQTANEATSTIGSYKTANDGRVSSAENKIKQNAEAITTKISQTEYNQKTGQIESDISKINQTAKEISNTVATVQTQVNSLKQINRIANSEFMPDLSGWTPSVKGTFTTGEFQYNGAVGVLRNSTGGIVNVYSEPTPLDPKPPTPVSWMLNYYVFSIGTGGVAYIYLQYLDSNFNIIPNIFIYPKETSSDVGKGWKELVVNNYVLNNAPAEARYIRLVVDARSAGTRIGFNKPMLVFDAKVGDYVPGQYINNDKIATQQITINGITEVVSKHTSDINSVTSRVTTAEGTITTTKNKVDDLESTQIQTAKQITSEVNDRKNGDTNTLTQANNFTTSAINSSADGLRSQITQTADAVVARIEATNMVVNSEFDPLNGTWYRIGTGAPVGTKLAESWKVSPSISFADWPVVNGSRVISYSTGNWYSSTLMVASAGKTYSASIVAGRVSATSGTALDFRIAFWDANKSLISNVSSGNIIEGSSYKGIQKYVVENKVAPANTRYVSVIIAHSSGNASDVISRPSLNTGEKAAPYAPTYGTSSSSTILSLFKDNWSIGIADNAGKLASGVFGDINGMTLNGKTVTINANQTVITGTAFITDAMISTMSASKLTAGTIDASNINVTNINASNIVSGAISGANLNINLNTGQVVFQRGRIYNASVDETGWGQGGIDVNIDKRYLASSNGESVSMLSNGRLSLIERTLFTGPTSTPYFEISNSGDTFDWRGAALTGTEKIVLTTKGDTGGLFHDGRYLNGLIIDKKSPAQLGGLTNGVTISGGQGYTDVFNLGYAPSINVGVDKGGQSTSEIHMYSSWIRASAVEERTTSNGANVYVASDGTLVRSSSSSKYKLDIEYERQADTANKLLTLDPATWHDKFENEQLDKFHEIGVDPERAIDMSNRRYYGIIAEDLVKAGLEHLVSRNVMTGEVEGVEYSKIGVALIPIIRELRNRLNEQYVEIERLKEQVNEQHPDEK